MLDVGPLFLGSTVVPAPPDDVHCAGDRPSTDSVDDSSPLSKYWRQGLFVSCAQMIFGSTRGSHPSVFNNLLFLLRDISEFDGVQRL